MPGDLRVAVSSIALAKPVWGYQDGNLEQPARGWAEAGAARARTGDAAQTQRRRARRSTHP
eukprot:CAMPEP_0203866480 /NCGR_PEP_ID=MMETSP0359-20131031/15977_1 /ASSEMBLY_ACC=CAM_ASM_000338 /TAXON_ID=268821 /ORGANISM="Scrippsiella Hangoei, Strain SHTV-5" /LENGTH=60 /DNA_ID=CAMNT_0050784587 /DNA_START=137 /DNA_END=316 /DNA_ORIENTATION=-